MGSNILIRFKGSSHNLVARKSWVQVEFSAEEEDSDSIVFKVTEAASGGLQ